jgi:hypothetical protein
MVLPTNVRAGKVTALLAGLQAAKGTAIADFTTGDAGRVWSDAYLDDVGPLKSDPAGWMTAPQMETGARFTTPRPINGLIAAKATPTLLEWLLRSCWGTFAGGQFTLSSYVSEWLTLAWVESVVAGAAGKFHRVYDAFIHQLTLRAAPLQPMTLLAGYAAAREVAPLDIADLVGVTLPADPMTPDDLNVFPWKKVRLFRDPLGDNEEIALQSVEVSIDCGLIQEWDMMQGRFLVAKGGFPGPRVTLTFEAHVSDETWEVLQAAIDDTKTIYRLVALAQAPATQLAIDFHDMDFEVEPLGHEGQSCRRFRAVGQAHRDSSGNLAVINLS